MATTITTQPASNSLNAAYRPVQLELLLDVVMPIVFCDIYFNGIFYKTLSISKPDSTPIFDIQDAAQEYLKKYLGANGGSTILDAASVITTCFCRFRGSTIDSGGFTVIDTVIPIQATGNTPAVPGTGLQSVSFYILYVTLQHDDNQDLATHLNSLKSGTWDADAFPLTHRKQGYKVIGSDYFGINYRGIATVTCLKINYKMKDGTTGNASNCLSAFPNCPVLTGLNIVAVDNMDGTQTFAISWTSPNGLIYLLDIQTRPHGTSDAWTSHVYNSSLSPRHITFPYGEYDFQIQVYSAFGGCNPTMSSIVVEGILPPSCVVPSFDGGTPVPLGALAGQAYSDSWPLLGTPAFSLSNVVKPSWLTIAISGSSVTFSGTPSGGDVGTGIPLEFRVSNACGNVDFAGTIDVATFGRTLTLTYEQGRWKATLSSAMATTLSIAGMAVNGTDQPTCTGYIESDVIVSFIHIVFGNTYAEQANNGLTCASVNYVVANTAVVNGQSVVDGDIIMIGSQNLKIIITPVVCSPYPC